MTGLAEIPCRVGQPTCTRVTAELLEGEEKGRLIVPSIVEGNSALSRCWSARSD